MRLGAAPEKLQQPQQLHLHEHVQLQPQQQAQQLQPQQSEEQELAEGGDFRSLKHQLQAVNLEDPAAVITVREIKNLIWPGATVEERLQAYFEGYGPVKDVLVPRAAVKQVGGNRRNPLRVSRIRSSNVGWVVMESASAVLGILRSAQHMVDGVTVRVEEFRKSKWDGENKPQEDETVDSASSSGSSKSVTRQKERQVSPVHDATWSTSSSASHSPVAMVPAACQLPMPWTIASIGAHCGEPQAVPTLVAPGMWGHPVVFDHCAVFNASEEELRQAMPESYDD